MAVDLWLRALSAGMIGLRAGYSNFINSEIPFEVMVGEKTLMQSASANYWYYGASINKKAGDFGTLSLNWDQNNGNEQIGFNNDPIFWAGWLKVF